MAPISLFGILMLLVLLVSHVSCSSYKGCSLEVPFDLVMNPEPEVIPLRLSIDIHIIGLTDVAYSGGSYGINVEYVCQPHSVNCFLNLFIKPHSQGFPEMGRQQIHSDQRRLWQIRLVQ